MIFGFMQFFKKPNRVKDFPSLYGKTVTPSGLLLASKSRPEGSRIELKPATLKARNTMSFKAQ